MKQLTDQEIRFIKETGWSPTICQMGYAECELERTAFCDLDPVNAMHAFHRKANEFSVDEYLLYKKLTDEDDTISLEHEAVYLFYTFFNKDQLEKLTNDEALNWLQDFQYFFGYRKWEEVLFYVQEAIDVYDGIREFALDNKGSIWVRGIGGRKQ